MNKILILVGVTTTVLTSCGLNCEKYKENFRGQFGSFKITAITSEPSFHCRGLHGQKGETVLYSESFFVLQPHIGDSIFKKKGIDIYMLTRNDSTFATTFSCEHKSSQLLQFWRKGDTMN